MGSVEDAAFYVENVGDGDGAAVGQDQEVFRLGYFLYFAGDLAVAAALLVGVGEEMGDCYNGLFFKRV